MQKTGCQLMAEQAIHNHIEHYHGAISLKGDDAPQFLDNYKGRSGFFMKKFLINDKMNLNRWRVTWDGIKEDVWGFVGKPVVLTPDKDHPHVSEQEDYRVGTIIDVGVDEISHVAWQVSQIFDKTVQKMILDKEVEFGSPTVLVHSLSTREQRSPGTEFQEDILHRFKPAHDALVANPAYGKQINNIPAVCTGDGQACALKLLQVSASTAYRSSINSDNTDQLTIVPFIKKVVNDRFTAGQLAMIVGKIQQAKTAEADSCVSRKIKIISDEHPSMPHDQVIAVAYSYCREKGGSSDGYLDMDDSQVGESLREERITVERDVIDTIRNL